MSKEKAHAFLSPSAAERWLICTPSPRKAEAFLHGEFPEPPSIYADEGATAHDLVECLLSHAFGLITIEKYNLWLEEIEKNQYYNEEMYDHCYAFMNFVIDKYAEVIKHTPDAKIYLEKEIDLPFIPESFGTADVRIVADNMLTVIDFKYGKGLPVSAVKNSQVMIYGWGSYLQSEFLYDIKEIEMIIYQPRLESITTFTMTVEQLQQWINDVVVPTAQKAWNGVGELIAGDHCQFCAYAPVCPALAEKKLVLAKMEFRLPDDLKDEEIRNVLRDADLIVSWINQVKEYALTQALNGYQWEGYKVVAGRSNRIYGSPQMVIDKLSEHFTVDKFLKPRELLGITALEKSIGTKLFKKHVVPLLIKPQAKPVLVPIDDERPAINSLAKAQSEFAQLNIEE